MVPAPDVQNQFLRQVSVLDEQRVPVHDHRIEFR